MTGILQSCQARSFLFPAGQNPAARPSADELAAHQFVASPPESVALSVLLPMIRASRELAAANLAKAEGPPSLPPGVRCIQRVLGLLAAHMLHAACMHSCALILQGCCCCMCLAQRCTKIIITMHMGWASCSLACTCT